jgi:hypothetical protein
MNINTNILALVGKINKKGVLYVILPRFLKQINKGKTLDKGTREE